MTITLDKIASVTKNARLPVEVTITDDMSAENGAIVVVEVLEDKKIYNQLELVSGRLSTLQKGDIIAVALGNRRALKGFVGETPATIAPGDTINVLNLGGVAGICTSENVQEVGHALQVKVLGAVTDGRARLNIRDFRWCDAEEHSTSGVPLIVISGTCMNVGKTTVACQIIREADRHGFTVFGAKLAGIAALRDTENMKDHGARMALSLVDMGCTSTVSLNGRSAALAKGAIEFLARGNPHVIVIEFGDGILGEYGVLEMLRDPAIQRSIVAHIGCAHDPVGALKLAEICADIGAPLTLISGPVTDNSVGAGFVRRNVHLPAFNAAQSGYDLFQYLLSACPIPSPSPSSAPAATPALNS